MFNEIQHISNKWVNEQKHLLADAQLLFQNINTEYGFKLHSLIEQISSLNSRQKIFFYKDHVFHNWLYYIKAEVLEAYENRGHKINFERLSSIIEVLHLAIAVLSDNEFCFCIYPSKIKKFLLPASGLYFDFALIENLGESVFCKYLPESASLEIENVKYPLLKFQGVESIKIVNNNFDFFTDPTGDKYNISFDSEIELQLWISTLEKALEILKADEVSFDLVSSFVSYLVPLKQNDVVTNLSFSVRNLPNVIFKNNELTPYLIGETLVHEADHQFFYAIEKSVNFWKGNIKLQQPTFFSPWRDDPRPLDGILRGLSSFARVSQYYSTIIRTCKFTSQQLEQVGLMLLQRLRESDIALNTILETQQLSEYGLVYVNEIQATLTSINVIALTFPQFERWNQHAARSIKKHKENWLLINSRE